MEINYPTSIHRKNTKNEFACCVCVDVSFAFVFFQLIQCFHLLSKLDDYYSIVCGNPQSPSSANSLYSAFENLNNHVNQNLIPKVFPNAYFKCNSTSKPVDDQVTDQIQILNKLYHNLTKLESHQSNILFAVLYQYTCYLPIHSFVLNIDLVPNIFSNSPIIP